MKNKKEEDNIEYIGKTQEKAPEKTLNKKKMIVCIIIAIILLIVFITFIVYAKSESFRNFFDAHIFFKHAEENNVVSIKADDLSQSIVFSYSNYIAIMKDNVITTYNTIGKTEGTMKVEVTTPLIATNGDYTVIAEKGGQRIYLISKNNIIWQKDLEGNISRINVNANGYVSAIVSGTSYKSVIELYSPSGDELFKTYLSSTIAVDTDISADNKFLAFAENNISGTLIQSNIKIISIDKAKENPSDAVTYTYNADAGSLIINIKYQKNKLVCRFDKSIYTIENGNNKKIADLNANGEKTTFADINLDNFALKTDEKSENLFNTNTAVQLINSSSEKINTYNVSGSVKSIYCCADRIGINLGSEIDFIDTNGWLTKKYIANQEIRGVAMGQKIAGIIYKDKIDILEL